MGCGCYKQKKDVEEKYIIKKGDRKKKGDPNKPFQV